MMNGQGNDHNVPDEGIRPEDEKTSLRSQPVHLWRVIARYLSVILIGNLIWELAHMPLYTLWYEGSWGEIVYAWLHCTAGDVMIAASALLIAMLIFGRSWLCSRQTFLRLAILTIVLGVSYTIFSEYLNITIRQSWAYSEQMPVIPLIDTGLSPLMQWIVLPGLAFRHLSRYLFRAA